MARPSIDAQIARLQSDHEAFRKLRRTSPKQARRQAIERLRRMGLIDSHGNSTIPEQ